MINHAINSFFIRPLAYIQGFNQPDEADVTIVSRYIGSNGYTVSIEATPISYKIKAKIISSNDASFEITVENICNGLDSRPLTLEQIMGMIHSGPHAFKAIYLPETNKVYVWAHMKAAGEGDFFMNNNAHNPFIGTNCDLLGKMLENANFKIPGTSKTVAEVGGFKNPEPSHGKVDERSFLSGDRSVLVHYDTGDRNKNKQSGQNHKDEPVHVGVKIWTKEAKEQVKVNYPINPRDPEWDHVVKEQKQVRINENPAYDPVPKKKSGGGGNGGSSGPSGRGGGNSGNTGSSGRGGGSSGAGGGRSGAGCGSTGAFQNRLNQNHLIDSYNRSHPHQPLLKTSHQ